MNCTCPVPGDQSHIEELENNLVSFYRELFSQGYTRVLAGLIQPFVRVKICCG